MQLIGHPASLHGQGNITVRQCFAVISMYKHLRTVHLEPVWHAIDSQPHVYCILLMWG